MSTFRVDVVPVVLEPHPNADTLSVIRVFGYTVVGKTQDWSGVTQAAYVPPDSVVPTAAGPFAFLHRDGRDSERVTVRRFRGVYSQGLLVQAPAGASIGDDVATLLGVTHYEPPINASTGGESTKPPPGLRPVYDVESFNRYPMLLTEGEEVMITEKIHGANGRWCFVDGAFHCGSRTEWKPDSEANAWWKALRGCPELQEYLKAHPDVTAYGEVYGQVQDLKYGMSSVGVRLFDMWDGREWFDALNRILLENAGVPVVPLLYKGPFSEKILRDLAEGKSTLADHVREGCVVKPIAERTCLEIGRVQLKMVGNGYLERKN